jgi:hypothetical protein
VIRTTVSFDRYSGCFSCGMPQELCQTFVRTATGMAKSRDEKDCTYGKALFTAAAVLVAKVYRTSHRRVELYKDLANIVGWFGWLILVSYLQSRRLYELS